MRSRVDFRGRTRLSAILGTVLAALAALLTVWTHLTSKDQAVEPISKAETAKARDAQVIQRPFPDRVGEHGPAPMKLEGPNIDSSGTGNKSSDKRQRLSQKEVEKLNLGALSRKTNLITDAYIEFAKLTEDDTEFLQELISSLEEQVKQLESENIISVEEDENTIKINISADPLMATEIEGEFRYAIRERLGPWQEDLFMKQNRNYFSTWLGDFGRLDQQVTIQLLEDGERYRFQVAAASPGRTSRAGSMSAENDFHDRMKTRVSFSERFIPERLSHLVRLP